MDPDATPDPVPDTASESGSDLPTEDTPDQASDAAPALGDEPQGGAAPTEDLPAAHGDHGHADDLVGDWATPDVDLSHLEPRSDGDPDDDEPEPAPVEQVDANATGQATITGSAAPSWADGVDEDD